MTFQIYYLSWRPDAYIPESSGDQTLIFQKKNENFVENNIVLSNKRMKFDRSIRPLAIFQHFEITVKRPDALSMHFEPDHIYHVYNRGNNKKKIFFSHENYIFFLRKVRNEWLHYCDLFCYCLMPNHFHFMLLAKKEGCEYLEIKNQQTHMQKLSQAIGKTLSSYAQSINIQNDTIGNLFQKKTKAKCLTDILIEVKNYNSYDYLLNCFNYIHNNPLEAMITTELKKWPYSSYLDYYGFRNDDLCARNTAMQRIGLSALDLDPGNEIEIDGKIIEYIW